MPLIGFPVQAAHLEVHAEEWPGSEMPLPGFRDLPLYFPLSSSRTGNMMLNQPNCDRATCFSGVTCSDSLFVYFILITSRNKVGSVVEAESFPFAAVLLPART